MEIQLNKKYNSEIIANTDLHAGGIFFCIIYRNSLLFKEDGKVEFTKILVDPFRPMDPTDIILIENFNEVGQYYLNDKGYIVCEFKDINWIFTGIPTEKDISIIPFHIFDSRLLTIWSSVFKCEKI